MNTGTTAPLMPMMGAQSTGNCAMSTPFTCPTLIMDALPATLPPQMDPFAPA